VDVNDISVVGDGKVVEEPSVMGCSLMAKCLPVKEKDIGSSPIVPVCITSV